MYAHECESGGTPTASHSWGVDQAGKLFFAIHKVGIICSSFREGKNFVVESTSKDLSEIGLTENDAMKFLAAISQAQAKENGKTGNRGSCRRR
jgi:hypothetical protein